jgi:hypothetical protein
MLDAYVGQANIHRSLRFAAFYWGFLLMLAGATTYLAGVVLAFLRLLFVHHGPPTPWIQAMVWYSGVPTIAGLLLVTLDLAFLLPRKRRTQRWNDRDFEVSGVTVALTAYNDEDSIFDAVRDFRNHPKVKRVIVVSNNSKDATMQRALDAGALVFNEPQPGYGRCVYRCYQEALHFEDTEAIVLCEGDRTFRARDIDKLLAYLPHAEIVNGTRIVEQLREYHTQLTTFMYYGNFFVGKLLELQHLGKGTFTDVGTTYKLLRRDALQRLMPLLNPGINLEFNAHFLDVALSQDFTLIECPVTFHGRVGVSKGGNVNDFRALGVGLRMIRGISLGWPALQHSEEDSE